jgi:hypothetical protein
MDWERYFETLIDWKKLPAYRAEPRVDSLIGFYLKEILEDFLKTQIEEIIPELPLRLGTIHPEYNTKNFADRSYKVDFFAVGTVSKNYFIEFKTDPSSRRELQDEYLNKSNELGSESIINGIVKISQVSSYKRKYNHLLEKLMQCGLLDSNLHYTGKNPKCENIYIIPANNKKEDNVIDYQWIVNWFKTNKKLDEFEIAFTKTLQLWFVEYSKKSNDNGA